MPPIGKADHDIVYIEYDIKAKRIQQAPRKISLYKRADMDGLHDHLARYRDSFLSTDHSQVSVNDMWVSFKSEVLSAIERFIPSKMTKTKYSLPWIDSLVSWRGRGPNTRRNTIYCFNNYTSRATYCE